MPTTYFQAKPFSGSKAGRRDPVGFSNSAVSPACGNGGFVLARSDRIRGMIASLLGQDTRPAQMCRCCR